MAFKIFPTEGDVGPTAGDGRKSTEPNMSSWLEQTRPINTFYADGTTVGAGGVGSGYNFDLASHTGGLTADISSGVANIRGFRVESTATIPESLTASQHNHIYLALTKTSGLVTGATLNNQVTSTRDNIGTPPADSIYLWDLETDGSTVTTALDYRNFSAGMCVGTYAGDGTNNRVIDIGFTPKIVHVYGRGQGSSPFIYVIGPITYPRSTGTPHAGKGAIYLQNSDETKSVFSLDNDDDLIPRPDPDGFLVSGASASIEAPQVLKNTYSQQIIIQFTEEQVQSFSKAFSAARIGDAVSISTDSSDATNQHALMYGHVVTNDNVEIHVSRWFGSTETVNIHVTILQSETISKTLNDSGEEYFFVAWA